MDHQLLPAHPNPSRRRRKILQVSEHGFLVNGLPRRLLARYGTQPRKKKLVGIQVYLGGGKKTFSAKQMNGAVLFENLIPACYEAVAALRKEASQSRSTDADVVLPRGVFVIWESTA